MKLGYLMEEYQNAGIKVPLNIQLEKMLYISPTTRGERNMNHLKVHRLMLLVAMQSQ